MKRIIPFILSASTKGRYSSPQSHSLCLFSTSTGDGKGSKKQPKIYTRTGDKGRSATFTGERRSKADPLFEALGTTDELSCVIGLAKEFSIDAGHPFSERLERIQCVLQEVSASIATPQTSARDKHKALTTFSDKHVKDLEQWIDAYTEELPELTNFILPSGGKTAASLHQARAVCRRAERRLVSLKAEKDGIDEQTQIYLNRLSDFLFTLSRIAAKYEKQEEKIYHRIYEDPST